MLVSLAAAGMFFSMIGSATYLAAWLICALVAAAAAVLVGLCRIPPASAAP